MADSWPSSLPDHFAAHNFNETPPSGVVRSQMSRGGDKTRPRSSKPVRKFTGAIDVDEQQRATFDDFLINNLSHGALPFEWKHPITRDPVTYRFVTSRKNPQINYEHIGGNEYRITFKLEILPQ